MYSKLQDRSKIFSSDIDLENEFFFSFSLCNFFLFIRKYEIHNEWKISYCKFLHIQKVKRKYLRAHFVYLLISGECKDLYKAIDCSVAEC